MSEKQARRPPVAPKPSFIKQDAATVKISPLPSSALQGATLAFGPGPAKVSTVAPSHNPSAGALLAATAAASKKQHPQQQGQNASNGGPGPSSRDLAIPSRGRQPHTENASLAAATLSSASPPQPGLQPHSPQSTSAVAAVAASAATSPAREPEPKEGATSSYLSTPEPTREARPRSISTSSTHSENALFLHKSPDALAGAIASMAHPPVHGQDAHVDKPKNDLSGISHLFVSSQPSSGSSPSPSPSGTAAAAMATRNAADAAARRRAESAADDESVRHEPFFGNVARSPPSAAGSNWPQIKLSPPDTPAETESPRDIESMSETPPDPLPAPLPVRPNRAAIVAQDRANGNQSEPPVLDARTKMTASSLADAMVASNLASRVASPASSQAAPPPPPPKPRRRSRSASLFEGAKPHIPFLGLGGDDSKSGPGSQTSNKSKPRPPRPMRQTLRNHSPGHEEKEEEPHKRGRRHWRRHPNMHHEGDRKRWRDRVTERERKRYEGVWAANKGLLVDLDLALIEGSGEKSQRQQSQQSEQQQHQQQLPQPRSTSTVAPSELVVNVVVRDIWERSRLPRDVLEEVWDLVARPGATALNREEFVVGMWLIDQRLKGRKLPVKVSPSVWQSVRHPQGVKISTKPLHKK
ncbi:Increased rDNA silencing protein 4 [Exophiala dermatitidis]